MRGHGKALAGFENRQTVTAAKFIIKRSSLVAVENNLFSVNADLKRFQRISRRNFFRLVVISHLMLAAA
jgi:hypothetical protein